MVHPYSRIALWLLFFASQSLVEAQEQCPLGARSAPSSEYQKIDGDPIELRTPLGETAEERPAEANAPARAANMGSPVRSSPDELMKFH
jgi:hypothetical protein